MSEIGTNSGNPNNEDGLKGTFEETSGPAVIEIDAHFVSSVAAMGVARVIENNRIEPTQRQRDQRFGVPSEVYDGLSHDEQEALKKPFFDQQAKRLNFARVRILNILMANRARAKEHPMLETEESLPASLETEIMLLGFDYKTGQEFPSDIFSEVLKRVEDGVSLEVALDEAYEENIDKIKDLSMMGKMAAELTQHRAMLQHALHPDKEVATPEKIEDGEIVVTDDLLLGTVPYFINPETGELRVEGVTSQLGTIISHGAIITKSMAMSYAHMDTSGIKTGDRLILDPKKGVVYVNPPEEIWDKYKEIIRHQEELKQKFRDKWSGHRQVYGVDGDKVNIHANFDISTIAAKIREGDPVGIGLVRTEMAYKLKMEDLSSREWYRHAFGVMTQCAPEDRKSGLIGATFRTIDLAGDKSDEDEEKRKAIVEGNTTDQFYAYALLRHVLGHFHELEDEDMELVAQFATKKRADEETQQQQRDQAIQQIRDLQATLVPGNQPKTHEKKLKVMVPQIKTPEEFDEWQGKMDAQAEKASEDLGMQIKPLKLGMMMETVEALDRIDEFDVAFFSVGTNDFYFSVMKAHYEKLWREQPDVEHEFRPEDFDRYGEKGDDVYDLTHPVFLSALKRVADHCSENKIPFSMCGAMASDARFHDIVRGLGFRDVSVDAASVPEMKDVATRVKTSDAKLRVSKLQKTSNLEMREQSLSEANAAHGIKSDGEVEFAWDRPETEELVIEI